MIHCAFTTIWHPATVTQCYCKWDYSHTNKYADVSWYYFRSVLISWLASQLCTSIPLSLWIKLQMHWKLWNSSQFSFFFKLGVKLMSEQSQVASFTIVGQLSWKAFLGGVGTRRCCSLADRRGQRGTVGLDQAAQVGRRSSMWVLCASLQGSARKWSVVWVYLAVKSEMYSWEVKLDMKVALSVEHCSSQDERWWVSAQAAAQNIQR